MKTIAAGAARAGVLAMVGALVFGSGIGAAATVHRSAVSARQLHAYVNAVEKVRLPVNTLLGTADPILDAYNDKKIPGEQAALEMNGLEEKFADYTVKMQEIRPGNAVLARINAPYAHTYLLEDNYLATLASDLNDGDFDNLPNTQDAQRLAIIEWRTALDVLAQQLRTSLPSDLMQAGRGEIAPAPDGS